MCAHCSRRDTMCFCVQRLYTLTCRFHNHNQAIQARWITGWHHGSSWKPFQTHYWITEHTNMTWWTIVLAVLTNDSEQMWHVMINIFDQWTINPATIIHMYRCAHNAYIDALKHTFHQTNIWLLVVFKTSGSNQSSLDFSTSLPSSLRVGLVAFWDGWIRGCLNGWMHGRWTWLGLKRLVHQIANLDYMSCCWIRHCCCPPASTKPGPGNLMWCKHLPRASCDVSVLVSCLGHICFVPIMLMDHEATAFQIPKDVYLE